MSNTIIVFAIAVFVSILAGGYISIKNHGRLHRVMAFSAGVILGVVFFEIFPELFHFGENISPTLIMLFVGLGFMFLHILEKSILIHSHHEENFQEHKHTHVGRASALAIIAHSMMDGLAIGLAFEASMTLGLAVAIAIIAHSFTDGVNTVNLILHHNDTKKNAKRFLFLNSLAPLAGVLLSQIFSPSDLFLSLYLGFLAGLFLYISTTDILPSAHAKDSSYKTIALTILGMLIIFCISLVAVH